MHSQTDSKENLKKRGIVKESNCIFCQMKNESALHVLWSYPSASRVLFGEGSDLRTQSPSFFFFFFFSQNQFKYFYFLHHINHSLLLFKKKITIKQIFSLFHTKHYYFFYSHQLNLLQY
jgi:hypothetical protein